MTTEDTIRQFYFKGDSTKSTAIHWEILKHARGKSLDFLGEDQGDRFQQYGGIGELKKSLKAKFGPNTDNPKWDVYNSVEYVRHVVSLSREDFKQKLESGMSHKEIAEDLKTYEEAVEKRHKLLDRNKLGEEVKLPANLKDYWTHFLYDSVPYDLVIDIDGPEVMEERTEMTKKEVEEALEEGDLEREEVIEYSYQEAGKIKSFLDSKDVPYSIKFSGGKGFHFEIPRHFKNDKTRTGIKNYLDSDSFAEEGKAFAKFIQERTGAIVDMGIYSSKRIFRTPYTVHTGSGLLCYPLTDREFSNFKLSQMDPVRLKRKETFRDQGLKTRKGDAEKLMKEYQDWKPEPEEPEEEEGEEKDPEQPDLEKIERLTQEIQNLSKLEKQLLREGVNLEDIE